MLARPSELRRSAFMSAEEVVAAFDALPDAALAGLRVSEACRASCWLCEVTHERAYAPPPLDNELLQRSVSELSRDGIAATMYDAHIAR